MIPLTKLNGDLIWVSKNSIKAVEPCREGVRVCYANTCVTVKEPVKDILTEILAG